MVDIDAAIGFVVARGDQVDRARLSWLRSELPAHPDMMAKVETGQTASGGWPAFWGGDQPSIDATCFRLAELDDLGALDRDAARGAVRWLASRQRRDGTWQEDESLADTAPSWARPGDPEASLYLTANAGFWLSVAGQPVAAPSLSPAASPAPGLSPSPSAEATMHAEVVARATQAFRAALRPDGSWPSFLVAGWLGGAMLYHTGWFYESAQIQLRLTDRIPDMSAADVAWLAAAFRRVGLSPLDGVLEAARLRLGQTQRTDGGWASDDGEAFDVHTTLAAIRGLR